jgi:hypothetical protein
MTRTAEIAAMRREPQANDRENKRPGQLGSKIIRLAGVCLNKSPQNSTKEINPAKSEGRKKSRTLIHQER